MKKTNKPLFTFLNIVVAVLIVVAFSTAFALNASAEGETSHIIAEGDCGWNAAASIIDSNLHWTLSSKGTVVVSGSGEMIPMFSFHPIWDDCIDPETTGQPPVPVKIVVIEPGATNISHCAFSYAVDMTTIVIPDTVTSIGTYAFEACDALKSVFYTGTEEQWAQIENVEEIEALENVTIRCNIVEWGYCGSKRGGFNDYSGDDSNLLWTQNADGQLVVSGEGEMANGWLNYAAMHPQKHITSAVVEAQIETLPTDAFGGIDSLTSVVLPEGMKTLGSYAFENCFHLTSVTIPASVTTISSHTFMGCYRIADVYFGGTREQWKQIDFGEPGNDERSNYNEEYLLKAHIHYLAEPDNISWTLEDGVLTISGTGAIWPTVETETEESTYWDSNTQTWKESNYTHVVQRFPWYTDDETMAEQFDGLPIDVYGNYVKKIVIGEGITEINGNAFRGFVPETIVLPASLERIASIKISHGDSSWSMSLPPFELLNLKDLYIGNPDAVFCSAEEKLYSEGYQLELYGATKDNTYDSYEAYRTWIKSFYDQYWSLVAMSPGYDVGEALHTLRLIYELRHQVKLHNYDTVNDDAVDVYISGLLQQDAENWEAIGVRYDTCENFETDAIAAVNAFLDTDFSSIEELFVLVPAETEGEKPTAEYAEAVTAALRIKFADIPQIWTDEVEDNPFDVETYSFGGDPISRINKGWNQETQSYDYAEIPVTPLPWLTVHGYAGSAAETAAAASGVRFAPLCPTDYTHTVTDKAEIAATCTTAGTEAGWYCEDCGVYLTGGETIPATNHPNAYEIPATEATATEHGHTAGVYCPDCNDWISGHDVIHNILGPYYPVEEAPDFDPDELIAYSEDGDYIIYCSVCNEPGLYKLEVGTPDEPGDSGSGNIFTRVIEAIRNAFGGVVNFFLRLIKWLGGK